MDVVDGIAPQAEHSALSYDDTILYEEQLPSEAERAAEAARATSLANRIGSSKVYLLSESSASATRANKKLQGTSVGAEEEDDDADTSDPTYRSNAILFHGKPIAHLPTARLFAYAKHFDANPMGLEWVDDQTCILVFPSRKDASDAFSRLTKPFPTAGTNSMDSALDEAVPMTIDDPVDPDYTHARAFPLALWPPEDRINQTLGKGQGLKGSIRMRWARAADIKKKGAKHASQFYKKHGSTAGKELFNGRDLPTSKPVKRKRQDRGGDEEERRRELDQELEDFLAEDDLERGGRKRSRYNSRSPPPPSRTPSPNERPPSPPSKMRSDYIADDGRTPLERPPSFNPRASDPLGTTPDLASRLMAPLPRRRRRGGRGRSRQINGNIDLDPDAFLRAPSTRDRREDSVRKEREQRRTMRGERPKLTQQQLDDELDAFLNGTD